MATQYYCGSERRRTEVRLHPTLNGVDFIQVLDTDYQFIFADPVQQNLHRQRLLLVRMMKPISSDADLATLDTANVRLVGGVRIKPVNVVWAHPLYALVDDAYYAEVFPQLDAAEWDYLSTTIAEADQKKTLVILVDSSGDYSTHSIHLVTSQADSAPPPGFDVQLSAVDFSFKVECPTDFDCKPTDECAPTDRDDEPLIDYLTKDYDSFRRLMLDRLSFTLPDWPERSPADVGVALVELMAYSADYLSYYQDAVANEAYLGTANKRVSIRRHARLLDYPMHDGRNARAWVQVSVNAPGVVIPKATPMLTKSKGLSAAIPTTVPPKDPDTLVANALGAGAHAYETLDEAVLYDAHNSMYLYTWLDEECCLPKGATRATLRDDALNRLRLRAGDVLVFEEAAGAATGLAADADPTKRHAVRLTKVTPEASAETVGGHEQRTPGALLTDALNSQPIVEIEWHEEDALPFPMCASAMVEGGLAEDLTVVRGNILLVDQGWTITDATALVPAQVPETGKYRPRLDRQGLTFALPHDSDAVRKESASAAMRLRLDRALPAISLEGDGEVWLPQRDLLNSDRFAMEFVAEMEDDGTAYLRFGDDTNGRRPSIGTVFTPTYRIGNGKAGNVGAGAIAHLMMEGASITGVRNPMPATGGTDPEPVEQVRLYAPQAFRRQERAVLVPDYAEVAGRHPEVQKAQATLRWTGSWHTVFITVDRRGGAPVTEAFKDELTQFMDRYRLIDRDVEINGPVYVPLHIVMDVCVEPGYYRSPVKAALLKLLSNRNLPDGTLGFFHPDNLTFNQPVYLSKIVTAAAAVPGVRWVEVKRFQRWGAPDNGELDSGVIPIGRLEVARLDNDRSAPENGRLELNMNGGL